MPVVVQPRQESGAESIAGSDRIDDMNRFGIHADSQVSMRAE